MDPVHQELAPAAAEGELSVRLLQLLPGSLEDSFFEPLPPEELNRWFPDAGEDELPSDIARLW